MNKGLVALYHLQETDAALAAAQRQYRALDPGVHESEAANAARAEHDTAATEYSAAQRDLHDAELELKSVEAKKKDFESKLYGGKVTAFKELESIQQEIEALGRQRGRLDERILGYLEVIESQRAHEEKTRATLQTADSAFAARQSDYKGEARVLARQIRDLTAQREARAALVEPALLKRYEGIRAVRDGVGIGRILQNSCGACHTSLPKNLIRSVIDTERLEICESCDRLLCYLEETEEE